MREDPKAEARLVSLRQAVAGRPGDDSLRRRLAEELVARFDRLRAGGANRAELVAVLAEVGREVEALARIDHRGAATVELLRQVKAREADLDRTARTTPAPVPSTFNEKAAQEAPTATALEWESPAVTLADVAGLEEVKRRLDAAVLAPLRHAEMAAAFSRRVSGGLLLWGPPGCGKTFVAKALAGQLEVGFSAVRIDDVLEMWLGNSEKNLAAVFDEARDKRPCILFLDELDALGGRRSRMTTSSMRTVVNTLLVELDGIDSDNEGLFVIGATNQPWDVDPALRRPGRFDRTVFVPPPDAPARAEILASALSRQPLGTVDLAPVVAMTDGLSGADVAHVAESAADAAFADSVAAGEVRPIAQAHLLAAAREVRSSIQEWLDTARTAALASNDRATFGPFLDWLDQRGR